MSRATTTGSKGAESTQKSIWTGRNELTDSEFCFGLNINLTPTVAIIIRSTRLETSVDRTWLRRYRTVY